MGSVGRDCSFGGGDCGVGSGVRFVLVFEIGRCGDSVAMVRWVDCLVNRSSAIFRM